MIISLHGNGAGDHKDEGKVREFLQKLQEDVKQYIVGIDYSPENSEDYTTVSYLYKGEDGRNTLNCKSFRD